MGRHTICHFQKMQAYNDQAELNMLVFIYSNNCYLNIIGRRIALMEHLNKTEKRISKG